MKNINDICAAVMREQGEKNSPCSRFYIPELDGIITMYKYFAVVRPHTEPGYLSAEIRIDWNGNFYKSICDAHEVKCWRKCRLKSPRLPLQWVLVNCDIPEDDTHIHAIALKFFRLFEYKSASVFYDPTHGLYWFLDADNEPYAVVCGIRSAKEETILS